MTWLTHQRTLQRGMSHEWDFTMVLECLVQDVPVYQEDLQLAVDFALLVAVVEFLRALKRVHDAGGEG